MIDSTAVTISLARVLTLLRLQPEDREAQKTAFRALVEHLAGQDLDLQVTGSALQINGTPVSQSTIGLTELRHLLQSHGVGQMVIPGSLRPAQLLDLMRALAAPTGTYPQLQQLRDIVVRRGIPGVQLAPPSYGGETTGPDGMLAALGPDAASEDAVGLLHFLNLETPSEGQLAELLNQLAGDPDRGNVSELLNQVVGFGEVACQREQWDEVLQVGNALVELEAGASNQAARRGYHIALRRLMSRTALEQVVRMAAMGTHKAEAIAVLRRFGAEGTELLLHALIHSNHLGERRALFSALSQMREGTELLVHMLGHDEWFVVRNVAYLCGELEVEQAIPGLRALTTHTDDRVRRAVATALGRIGTPASLAPLQNLLGDASAIVRLDAAMGIHGEQSRGLVPVIAELIPREQELDVQREMLLALARIATPGAVEVLAAVAAGGRGLFQRKATALRLAAIEALRQTGAKGATAVLRGLSQDKDPQVREAVQLALAER